MGKKKKSITENPLIISLIGILIVSIIIPIVSSIYSNNRYLNDKKNEISFEVIENNKLTNSEINNVFTAIEIFNKNSRIFTDSLKLKAYQIESNKNITDLYLNFNSNSWHWQMSLHQKIKTLKFNQDFTDVIKDKLFAYKANLIKRTELLDQVWTVNLRTKYDSIKAKEFTDKTRRQFNDLEEKNNQLIFEIAYYIKNN